MDKLATIYIMINVIILTFTCFLTLSKRSQLRKNTEEIQKLARQLGVNDEKTFHAEFSEQYNKIMDNIGKTPNDKALNGNSLHM